MRTKEKFNFTVNKIKNLPTPEEGKRGVYFDERVQGLKIIVTDKDRKSYYVRRLIKGRSKRIWLGLVYNLSIKMHVN